MNEAFYQLYKSGRDMIEEFRHKDLSDPFQDFIESIEIGHKRLDKTSPQYYERWKKERFGDE